MTATAYLDPIASMTTMPVRALAPPAPAPYVRPPAPLVPFARPAPPLGWSTHPRQQAPTVQVPVIGSDRQLQRLALGLLLTVVLLGIPLAVYLASLA